MIDIGNGWQKQKQKKKKKRKRKKKKIKRKLHDNCTKTIHSNFFKLFHFRKMTFVADAF